ncbi:MAG: ATP-binding protein, partial [Myxococcota bacterium]
MVFSYETVVTRTSGTLYLLCGKMAAGKSTLARSLRQNHGAVLLAEDELLERLYPGEIAGLSDYVRCSKRLKEALSEHICSLLQSGLSIVLDFPANTKSQRVWMRELIDKSEAEHEL